MTIDELEHKEAVLRSCFKEKLAYLNVDGDTDIDTVKLIKTYGALWHYAHQLLLAEEHDKKVVNTFNINAGGK